MSASIITLSKRPTLTEWLCSKGGIICDVRVRSECGDIKIIRNCNFEYTFNFVDWRIVKHGSVIINYSILADFNYRLVA